MRGRGWPLGISSPGLFKHQVLLSHNEHQRSEGLTWTLNAAMALLHLGRKVHLHKEAALGSVQALMDICSAWISCSSNTSILHSLLKGLWGLPGPKITSRPAISHKSLEHGTWNNKKKKQEFNNKYGKVRKQENWKQMKRDPSAQVRERLPTPSSLRTIPNCAFAQPSAYAPSRFGNPFVVNWKL